MSRSPKSIWEAYARRDEGISVPLNATYRSKTAIGALLLKLFPTRVYSYAIGDAPKIAWLRKALVGTGRTALDIGVRTGWGARLLGSLGKDVYGIDIADTYISEAKAAGDILDGWVCDIERASIPVPSGGYDVIYFSEVIEHLVEGGRVLKELAKVLKLGGHLIITTPNLAYIENRMRLLLGRDLHSLTIDRAELGNQHIRVFTLRLLRRLCREAGLVADITGSDGIPLDVSKHIDLAGHPVIFSVPTTPSFGRTIYIRAVAARSA